MWDCQGFVEADVDDCNAEQKQREAIMYMFIGKPKSISELKWVPPSQGKIREDTEIAVVDNEKFEPAENLRNRKFRIVELGDPSDIKAVEPYKIVLCDIRGVGKSLGSPLEGSHLIKTIKTFYPFKYVIAYTGQGLDMKHNENLVHADRNIPKDADIDIWEDALNRAITAASDPKQVWIITRKYLLEQDVSLLRLLKLEDLFVCSIESHKDLLSNRMHTLKLSEDTLNLLKAFVTGSLAKLLGTQ